MAVRSRTEDFMRPYVYTTATSFQEYFFAQYKQTLSEFSMKVEAYSVSGMAGK